jgi:hypothetical protein
MGESGRRHVAAHYDRALIAKQFEKLLLEIVEGAAPDTVRQNSDAIEDGPRRICEGGQISEAHSKTGRS